MNYCNDSRTHNDWQSAAQDKLFLSSPQDAKEEYGWQRCFKRTLLRGEKKERCVERLWTTTTTSIPDKARRDKTKGRNYVSKRASDSVHTVLAHRERQKGRECGREGGMKGSPVIKRNENGVLHSSCRQDTHHLI